MRFGQLIAGVGIGLVVATTATAGGTVWQHWRQQEQTRQAIGQAPSSSTTSGSISAGQGVLTAATSPETRPETNQSVTQPMSQLTGQPARQTATVTITQAENDYLYDLSQALQSSEQRRLTDAERLAIGRQTAGWLQAGSGYWEVRNKFDQTYKAAVAADYAYNREVYIKFATERLAPAFVATLTPPPPEPQVIVQTRTEYIETPGQTKIVAVPQPFPVPIPRDDSHRPPSRHDEDKHDAPNHRPDRDHVPGDSGKHSPDKSPYPNSTASTDQKQLTSHKPEQQAGRSASDVSKFR